MYFYVFLSKIVGEARTMGSYQEDRRKHRCRGSWIVGVSAGSVGKAVQRPPSILFKSGLADWPSRQAPRDSY